MASGWGQAELLGGGWFIPGGPRAPSIPRGRGRGRGLLPDTAAAAALMGSTPVAAAALIGSGMTLVDPNLLGILAPAMFLCSRATCLLTVLFLVNVLGQ